MYLSRLLSWWIPHFITFILCFPLVVWSFDFDLCLVILWSCLDLSKLFHNLFSYILVLQLNIIYSMDTTLCLTSVPVICLYFQKWCLAICMFIKGASHCYFGDAVVQWIRRSEASDSSSPAWSNNVVSTADSACCVRVACDSLLAYGSYRVSKHGFFLRRIPYIEAQCSGIWWLITRTYNNQQQTNLTNILNLHLLCLTFVEICG